jgi:hypothetical protein
MNIFVMSVLAFVFDFVAAYLVFDMARLPVVYRVRKTALLSFR